MKTRLLIVIIDLNAGTATYCRTLATGLRRHHGGQLQVELLLLRDRGVTPADRQLFDAIHAIGSSVHSDWRRFHESLRDILRLRRTIAAVNPDMLLTVGTYACLLVPRVAGGRPVVLTVHTHASVQLREVRFGGIIRWLTAREFRGRTIVAPTQGLADDLVQNFGVPSIHVIPHAVDAELLRQLADETPAGLPLDGPYILACGRLAPQKDYPTLLNAYATARSRGLSMPLFILGDGELRDALQDLARQLNVADSVHFLGHRDNPFAFMRRASFLVQASVWEGFGLALLEALAVGLPVIATDCPSGPSEILDGGRYGMLVPTDDAAALADAMLAMAGSPPVRDDFAGQARERAEQLSLRNMARRYVEVFRSAGAAIKPALDAPAPPAVR